MNKTISINISGFVFNIEEQAYEVLNQYLKSIKNNFADEDERAEIMADIEARIAELFQEKTSGSKEVIIEADVQDIINIMGTPEDYLSDDPDFDKEDHENTDGNNMSGDESKKEESYYADQNKKRLFRDEDNGSLGGVCAGLGHYFNVDVTLVRAVFILLVILGGSGILIYLILLFIVPEAKTTADKLQMKGQSVTLDSIKEHARNFKNEFTDRAKNSGIKRTMKRTFHRGAEAGGTFVKAFSKIIGVGFSLGGIFALFVLITIFFGNSGLLPIVGSEQVEDLPTLIEVLYPGSFQHNIIFIAVIFVTLIPIVAIITTGIKLLFDIKQSFKPVAIGFTIIWFIGIGTLTITGIDLGMNFRSETKIDTDIPMMNDSTDVLFIDVLQDDVFSEHIEYNHVWNYTELIKVDKEKIFMGYPELIILEKEDSSNFEITLIKESHGLSLKDAINKAENIDYDVSLNGNKLFLPPYFSINRDDKLRGQKPIIEIQVPKGKKVSFGKNIDRILVWIEGDNYFECSPYFYANTTWMCQENELKCIESK